MRRLGFLIIILVFFALLVFFLCHKGTRLGKVSVYELGNTSIGLEDDIEKSGENDSQKIYNPGNVAYAIDKKTGMPADLFNISEMSSKNLHINKERTGPKILIFHTHGSEMYADSKNVNEGVIEAGERLKKILESKYNIDCLHITERFDVVNGKIQRDGAYERAEPVITEIIKKNPSIQLVIDLHRDGVNENLRLVTSINGKSYAKIMFFNGICRKWDKGELVSINNLENPYIKTNLALSYQMQKAVLDFDKSLPRKIYINAYRYSLHMKDKSMLIELGAQTNTRAEVANSIEVIANAIGRVCL